MKTTQQVKESREKDNTALANCLVLASSFNSSLPPYAVPMLLLTKPPILKFKSNFEGKVSEVVFRIQRSIAATAADSCLRFLQSHLLNKLLSLPSHFQNFSQIHQRSYQNVSLVSNHSFAAILPGDSVAGIVVANGISNFLNIYNTLLICRLVLTWFPNSPPAIVSPLSTICDPYLNIFRGIIPPLGGTLDLSPILAFLVLNAFTSTAAALPAELPPTLKSHIITAETGKKNHP